MTTMQLIVLRFDSALQFIVPIWTPAQMLSAAARRTSAFQQISIKVSPEMCLAALLGCFLTPKVPKGAKLISHREWEQILGGGARGYFIQQLSGFNCNFAQSYSVYEYFQNVRKKRNCKNDHRRCKYANMHIHHAHLQKTASLVQLS